MHSNSHIILFKMQNILLLLSGHAHLAEPGRLCIKQALWANARAELVTRRTDHLSQTMVWAPEVPPELRLVYERWPSRSSWVDLWDGVGWTSHTTWWWGKRMTTPNQLGHVGDLNSQPYDYEPNVLPTAPQWHPHTHPHMHTPLKI